MEVSCAMRLMIVREVAIGCAYANDEPVRPIIDVNHGIRALRGAEEAAKSRARSVHARGCDA